MKNIEKINRRNMMMRNLVGFAIELKNLVRNSGRTNIITINKMEELFNKYEINLRELEEMR